MSSNFTEAFNNLADDGKEAFYRTVFMHMDTEAAAKLRQEYYSGMKIFPGRKN